MARAPQDSFSSEELRVIAVLWATYGAFYFCRSNISAAIPGLQQEFPLTKTQIGMILGGLKLTYGIGQLINGQLAERISPRWLLAIGMFTSAGLSLIFGFGTGFYFFLFAWGLNGYFQALGWTPCMRVAASWFSPAKRGRAIPLIATGYLLAGGAVAYVAGLSADRFGWRGAMIVPSVILAAVGVFTLFALRPSPAVPAAASPEPSPPRAEGEGWTRTLGLTVRNPRLWLLALALAMVDACRYGFLDWGITHLTEIQGGGVGKNAAKFAFLPFGGVVGALSAGWLSDRLFGGRRIPVMVGLLVMGGVVALFYESAVQTSAVASSTLLVLIGISIYGAQVLLVGPAAMDMARADKSAAAIGFVNFMGYLGAFTADPVTGYLVDHHGWSSAVVFWASCAFGAAIILLPLWRYSALSDPTR